MRHWLWDFSWLVSNDLQCTVIPNCNVLSIGDYQAKDLILQKYLAKMKECLKEIETSKVKHVSWEQNIKADVLLKLASTKPGDNNKSLIQEMLRYPSITEVVISKLSYLQDRRLPLDLSKARKLSQEATHFTLIIGQLYKKGLSELLLKCLGLTQISYALEKVHKDSCRCHLEGCAFALKMLRVGYYWATIIKDLMEFVKWCWRF